MLNTVRNVNINSDSNINNRNNHDRTQPLEIAREKWALDVLNEST